MGAYIHQYAPHTATTLYIAAACSALLALALVFGRCLVTGCVDHLNEKWIFQTATAAAPMPTYLLLILLPLDPDLSPNVLDDKVVVALAGLYGLVEAGKEIKRTASRAHAKKKSGTGNAA